jgi:hypothetical protein
VDVQPSTLDDVAHVLAHRPQVVEARRRQPGGRFVLGPGDAGLDLLVQQEGELPESLVQLGAPCGLALLELPAAGLLVLELGFEPGVPLG